MVASSLLSVCHHNAHLILVSVWCHPICNLILTYLFTNHDIISVLLSKYLCTIDLVINLFLAIFKFEVKGQSSSPVQ